MSIVTARGAQRVAPPVPSPPQLSYAPARQPTWRGGPRGNPFCALPPSPGPVAPSLSLSLTSQHSTMHCTMRTPPPIPRILSRSLVPWPRTLEPEKLDTSCGVHLFCHIWGAHRALYPCCAKSRLFSTTGSHGSQGPEFCTLHPLLVHQGFSFQPDACHGSQGPEFCTPCCFELIMHPSVGGWFSGVFLG